MDSSEGSRRVPEQVGGPGDAHRVRAPRRVLLIRALGWVGGLVALLGGLADLPAVTFVAVPFVVGTMVATYDKPGHSTIAENALALLLAGAAFVAFWPPLWF